MYHGKTVKPRNGSVTCSMKTVVAMAISAATNCAANCGQALNSHLSSDRPKRNTKAAPISTPPTGKRSRSFRGAKRYTPSAGRKTRVTSPIPPICGTASACWRRPPGTATRPNRCPSRPARGVVRRARANGMRKARGGILAIPGSSRPLRRAYGQLARPKLPISRVSQAWHDVGDVVQVAVNRADVDGHVRVIFLHLSDAFRRGDQADVLDLRHPPFFQERAGRRGRAAGRQHRVEDEAELHAGLNRLIRVILHGLERALVALEADVPDLRAGHHLPD